MKVDEPIVTWREEGLLVFALILVRSCGLVEGRCLLGIELYSGMWCLRVFLCPCFRSEGCERIYRMVKLSGAWDCGLLGGR